MNSPVRDLEGYWAQLSAANPAVQSLEGSGTQPQFDAPKVQHYSYSQRSGSSFKPDL